MITIQIAELINAKMKQKKISEDEAIKEINDLLNYCDNYFEGLTHLDRSVIIHKSDDWRFTHSFRIREEADFFDLMVFKSVKK